MTMSYVEPMQLGYGSTCSISYIYGGKDRDGPGRSAGINLLDSAEKKNSFSNLISTVFSPSLGPVVVACRISLYWSEY